MVTLRVLARKHQRWQCSRELTIGSGFRGFVDLTTRSNTGRRHACQRFIVI
jgi:hypothetical protein